MRWWFEALRLPQSNVVRRSHREYNIDLGGLLVVQIIVIILTVLSIAYVSSHRDLEDSFINIAMVMWSTFGTILVLLTSLMVFVTYNDFAGHVRFIYDSLGLSAVELTAMSESAVRYRATEHLRSLAQTLQEIEKVTKEGWPEREKARGAFGAAFNIFQDSGLIANPDAGYGPFFEPAKA